MEVPVIGECMRTKLITLRPDMQIEEAIRAYTSWPASASNLEHMTGTLEKGKWADITVLSLDPFNTAPRDLLSGEVYLTIVDGRIVYGNLPNSEAFWTCCLVCILY